ncbi:MAG TPA: alpha/beta fold hydrolase [Gemmatimonadaceae bacterium]|nr:alpha/beta fold hydrolase [Gemmatimonadaceae bacterium]
MADDGIRNYVIEFGRGDTVVVLHGGWGGEHSGLIEAVRPLSDRFHFVLYDQRGSLRSPAPDSTITIRRLVRDLDGLRKQLGQERLVLLGHSMGAALAYAYLAEHPRRVRGMVLFAPVRPTDDAFRDLGVPPSDTVRLGSLRRALGTRQDARRVATLVTEGLGRVDTKWLHRPRADGTLAHRVRCADARQDRALARATRWAALLRPPRG